ncbi:MAG: hypothetical protein M1827_005816 [Pycnora praestabilis]|nr:MAG: hypothetical protein M1827_005816 [Pycnora praestabilis]
MIEGTEIVERGSHCVWTHWVDSHSSHPEDVNDEGDMFTLRDDHGEGGNGGGGDGGTDGEGEEGVGKKMKGDVVERGTMIDPETGMVGAYEECWRDLVIQSVSREEEGKRVGVVLRTVEGDEHGSGVSGVSVRGMIIRVGDWCQGLLKIGDEVTVERWKYVSAGGTNLAASSSSSISHDHHPSLGPGVTKRADGVTVVNGSMAPLTPLIENSGLKEGDWERVARMGVRFLPCAVTFEIGREALKERDRVQAGDIGWEVIERFEW